MSVVAFDPLVSGERFRELGVEKAPRVQDVYARARLPDAAPAAQTTRRAGMIDAGAIALMRDGVRILNVARGGLLDDGRPSGGAGSRSGKVAGAALDVFPSEPITDYPLVHGGHPKRRRDPAPVGASTAEATRTARGCRSAEQIVAAGG